MKCTIQSIADELELSRNTVARVLSGKDGVSAKTRKLVLRKAEEMGYGKTAGEPSVSPLPKRQIPTPPDSIVFLTGASTEHPELRTAVIKSAEDFLQKNNYNLILSILSDRPDEELQLPALLHSPSIKGILLMDLPDPKLYESILRLNLPVAAIGLPASCDRLTGCMDIISPETRMHTYRLLSSIYKEGLKQIGYVGDTRITNGYEDLLEAADKLQREFDLANIEILHFDLKKFEMMISDVKVSDEKASNVKAFDRKISDTLPDLCFCQDDWTAIRLLHSAQAAGLSVPEELSIVGFGNIPESEHVFPRLSTIQMPGPQMGSAAARCILERIQDPQLPYVFAQYSPTFIKRGT